MSYRTPKYEVKDGVTTWSSSASESGNIAVFKGLSAGSFLPILVTHLLANNGAGVSTDVTDVLALY